MYKPRLQGITQKMFFLLVCFFIASESMAQVPFLPVAQKQNQQTVLPFTLPEELFPNSYPVFPNAREMREIEYTEMGRILVYFYDTKDVAENDMKIFAGKNKKISAEDSSILAAHSGCWEENEQFSTGWFTIGSYVVGIRTPGNKSSRALLSKTAEKIITDYDARVKLMFSTPEKCFNTYLDAVKNQEEGLIIECLYNDGSEESRNAISMARYMISAIPMMRMYEMPRTEKEIVIDKVEMVSATEAKIGILRQREYNHSLPLTLLTFGQPTSQYSTGKHLWIPVRMSGGKWGIDILTVQKIAFAKSQEQSLRIVCINNLKQIGLALHMYAQDHKDKFPDNIRELCPSYISTGKVLKCPADKTTPETQKIEPDTPISYTYVKGLSRQNPNSSKIIVLYDSSPEYHEGEGRNILFLDGHVVWMPEEQFQKLMGEQKF